MRRVAVLVLAFAAFACGGQHHPAVRPAAPSVTAAPNEFRQPLPKNLRRRTARHELCKQQLGAAAGGRRKSAFGWPPRNVP